MRIKLNCKKNDGNNFFFLSHDIESSGKPNSGCFSSFVAFTSIPLSRQVVALVKASRTLLLLI